MAKTEVYRLTADPDRFAGFKLAEGTDKTYKALLGLKPLKKTWKGLPVEVDRLSSDNFGDFPWLFPSNCPVVSQRALSALELLISNFVEVLPLGSFSGQDFFVIHVLEEIDALEKEKSKWSIVDGKKGSIHKFVFHEPMLAGKHIFRIPELRHRQPLVSKDFKKCVEAHKLKGAKFTKLP